MGGKVFVMIAVAQQLGYGHVLSIDDDVMLSPATLFAMLDSPAKTDEKGCGAVVPLTQNGIPTTELWAQTWLDEYNRRRLFDCFSGTSGQFCSYLACWPE